MPEDVSATAPTAGRYRAELWGDITDHPSFSDMLLRRVDGLSTDTQYSACIAYPCPERLHLALPGAIPSALAKALEQSSVGLQVTCRACADTNGPPRGLPPSRVPTRALVWCAALSVGMAGGARRPRALRCGGAGRSVLTHRAAACSGIAPAIAAASLADS